MWFFQFDPCGSIFLHVDDKEYDNRAKTVLAGMIAKIKAIHSLGKGHQIHFLSKQQLPSTYANAHINR